MPLNTPVVFIIFNRPDLTQIVFNAIRQAQPKQLFVVADGPRFPEETEKCQAARDIIKQVDWDCEVSTNYADTNLGCRQRVSSGITWAFEQVEEAIILEDDCLPHLSFFFYCETLLNYYRHDERVMVISGNNFQDGQQRTPYSYYFSKYNHCWGWATWRRAWKYWEFNPEKWKEFRDAGLMKFVCDTSDEENYWTAIFNNLFLEGKPNSWAYAWTFACWSQGGLTALPNVNLVSNIGFGDAATHTKTKTKFANIATKDIGKIYHPPFVIRHREADIYTVENLLIPQSIQKSIFKITMIKLPQIIKSTIKNIIFNRKQKESLLSIKEINHLSRMPRYMPGLISSRKGLIKFIDACTLMVGNKEIFIDEIYKFNSSSNKPLIIDCGANIGLATIYFKIKWPHSTVLAFEPDPSAFECLTYNLKSLGLEEGTVTKQAAVWVHSEGVSFDVEGGFSGQITKHGHSAVKKTITVPSIRLKEIVLANSQIDLLKVDIEGAEFEVLSDIADVLENVNNIFIEYHSHIQETQKLDQILAILSKNSFRYHINSAYTVNHPFINRETMLGMDLQLNIFGYRN